ncbi:MAG: DUF2069 domain-containing protein [Janthinobacterium lividum]
MTESRPPAADGSPEQPSHPRHASAPAAPNQTSSGPPSAASPPSPPPRRAVLGRLSFMSLLTLIVVCVSWELWLAPLRPGGSILLALKAVPLCLALPGIWRRNPYTMQWSSMLVLLYFIEGVVRAFSEPPPSATLAELEIALSVVHFCANLGYLAPLKRAARAARRQAPSDLR